MKKFILTGLTVMLVLGLVSTAFAFNGAHQGNGGLIALGLQNYQTTNLGNTWINPAAINNYKNKAYGFLGSYNNDPDANAGFGNAGRDAMAGAHFDTPAGVIGIWINRGNPMIDGSTTSIGDMDAAVDGTTMAGIADSSIVDVATLTPNCDVDADGIDDYCMESATGMPLNMTGLDTPHNNIDLFYGRDIGAALLGVRINYNATKTDDTFDHDLQVEPYTTTALNEEVTEATENIKLRDIGLHFGVAMKDMPINASLLIGLPSALDEGIIEDKTVEDTNTNAIADTTTTVQAEDTIESDGAMNIGLYVNGALKLSDTTTLVPTVFFEKTKNNSTRSSSYTNTLTTTADAAAGAGSVVTTFESEGTREGSGMVFGIDGALNMKPNDATLVVAALGLTYVKSTTLVENEIVSSQTVTSGVAIPTYHDTIGMQDSIEQVQTSISIPFVVGVQNKTFKKVTTRLGMKANIYERTKTELSGEDYYGTATVPSASTVNTEGAVETTTSGTINNGNAVTVSMGFSAKLGEKMGLTAVLNEDILFGGGYLISGIPETLSTIVSVGYSW